MNVSVIGCGRLGVPYATTLAEIGHDVVGVDTDPTTVERLNAGCPFEEPGLAARIAVHLATGRLRFTTSYQEAAAAAQIHVLCVPTPQQAHHTATDLTALHAAIAELVPSLVRDSVIVVKSSVPVGTTASLALTMAERTPVGCTAEVVYSPDFLREATSLDDALLPSRIVLGLPAGSGQAELLLREVWRPFTDQHIPLIITDLATAELTKLAANSLIATRISFINAWAGLCERVGADAHTLANALMLDPRLGSAGLTPGLGFGGSCISKDLRAAVTRAEELGCDELQLLHRVDEINQRQRAHCVSLARDLCGGALDGRNIGVWGLSFKPGVDDITDSPALDVALRLYAEGATVTCYDPIAMENARATAPQFHYVNSAEAAATRQDLLLVLTDWVEFTRLDPQDLKAVAGSPIVLDTRHVLNRDSWANAGWSYRALGRGVASETVGQFAATQETRHRGH